jgi:glycine cleavage system aminomethyltransferase T/glycine/D-amino acid oxidase-like deaminating enzyme
VREGAATEGAPTLAPGTGSRASAVIIGAGIVGNSLVHHLALLGWKDLVLVDKGPLPNPGGSTGHASNFIFPIEYSKMMFELTRDSTEQYRELGVFTESGGIEVARTPERMTELKRRITQAKAWGIPAEQLTADGVQELVPYLDPAVILGGGYFPTVGVVDSLRAGTLMRERAQAVGALTVLSGTEVLDITTAPDGAGKMRVRSVVTSAGEIGCDNVVICCGVWSPRVARLAGARLALTPIVHQMISVGPIGLFAGTTGEISYPIVRDVDNGMYERQHGGDMEVGSYAHRPILVWPDDIPSNEAAVLSPTELPFTSDDFDPQLEQALELMPELLGDEKAGTRYAINGLISMTPDGHPLLGEVPEVRGLWAAAASWIKEGPGCGRAVAELMSGKVTTVDVHEAAAARFYPAARTAANVRDRAAEAFNKMYGIVHPREQYESARPMRVSPLHERTSALGAVYFETARWERPQWYAGNEGLLEKYAGQLMERPGEWDSRWWSPITNAEHLALRETAGLVDLSAFTVLDVTGPAALAGLQDIAVVQLDVPVGKVVYTSFLNPAGGIVADLTIMRLGRQFFRVVTGAADGARDATWISDHLPAGATVTDVTSAWSTLGLWGPRAGEIFSMVLDEAEGWTEPAGSFGSVRSVEVGGSVVLASRISYVGEFGWELHVPSDQAGQLWDRLWTAGQPAGLAPVGIGVYGTTARLEKGYRAFGAELTPDYNLVEAGMTRPRVKAESFIGKDAYLAQRLAAPAAILATLTVDSPASADGTPRYPQGGEPILALDGARLVDVLGRPSYVTSAGSGPSVGQHLAMAYLPPPAAAIGTRLLLEYLGEQYPVTVAAHGAVFDPSGSRMRAGYLPAGRPPAARPAASRGVTGNA